MNKTGEPLKISISAFPDSLKGLAEKVKEVAFNYRLPYEVKTCSSMGYYKIEPVLVFEEKGFRRYFTNVTAERIDQIFKEYLEGEKSKSFELPFPFEKRVILEKCGLIDPAEIEPSFMVTLKRLFEFESKDLMEKLEKAGILKREVIEGLRIFSNLEDEEKYLLFNAVDGEPAEVLGNLLCLGKPERVLLGIFFCAYMTKTGKAILSIDGKNFSEKSKILKKVMADLDSLCKKNNFSLEIEIVEVPSSLVAKEEDAILNFLQGRQLMPSSNRKEQIRSLRGHPTFSFDLWTLVLFGSFIENLEKPASFSTVIVTIAEREIPLYTLEVEKGTKIAEIIESFYDLEKIKALQLGGSTGRLIARKDFDRVCEDPILIEVLDEKVCPVEFLWKKLSYICGESCGKCVFCREGTYQVKEMLEEILKGEGSFKKIELIKKLGQLMGLHSLCRIGKETSEFILSVLEIFRGEFEALIDRGINYGKSSIFH